MKLDGGTRGPVLEIQMPRKRKGGWNHRMQQRQTPSSGLTAHLRTELTGPFTCEKPEQLQGEGVKRTYLNVRVCLWRTCSVPGVPCPPLYFISGETEAQRGCSVKVTQQLSQIHSQTPLVLTHNSSFSFM